MCCEAVYRPSENREDGPPALGWRAIMHLVHVIPEDRPNPPTSGNGQSYALLGLRAEATDGSTTARQPFSCRRRRRTTARTRSPSRRRVPLSFLGEDLRQARAVELLPQHPLGAVSRPQCRDWSWKSSSRSQRVNSGLTSANSRAAAW